MSTLKLYAHLLLAALSAAALSITMTKVILDVVRDQPLDGWLYFALAGGCSNVAVFTAFAIREARK